TTEWFSDWSAIDLVQRDGSIDRLVIESRDRVKVGEAIEVDALRRYPSDPTASEGVRRGIRPGRWEMLETIQDDWLVREAHGRQDYLALLRSLNIRSYLCVPLKVGDLTLGALTFVTTGEGRVFG